MLVYMNNTALGGKYSTRGQIQHSTLPHDHAILAPVMLYSLYTHIALLLL